MSQLFTDISAEEQEIVAGGTDYITFGQLSQSIYDLKNLTAVSNVATVAGPGGAGTNSVNALQTNTLLTNALNQLGASFPAK